MEKVYCVSDDWKRGEQIVFKFLWPLAVRESTDQEGWPGPDSANHCSDLEFSEVRAMQNRQ
jgi:hypothetical protein